MPHVHTAVIYVHCVCHILRIGGDCSVKGKQELEVSMYAYFLFPCFHVHQGHSGLLPFIFLECFILLLMNGCDLSLGRGEGVNYIGLSL